MKKDFSFKSSSVSVQVRLNTELHSCSVPDVNLDNLAKVQNQWTMKYVMRSWLLYIPACLIEVHPHMKYQLATINRSLFYLEQKS